MLDYPQYVPRPEGARGPDPLGMQSTIMGLYRKVLPGLNNRARYIRVYSAICWMVSQIWDTLDDDASDEAIQAAFDAGIPKIQLLLVWGNTRWNVRATAARRIRSMSAASRASAVSTSKLSSIPTRRLRLPSSTIARHPCRRRTCSTIALSRSLTASAFRCYAC